MGDRKRILYYNHTRLVSGGERVLLNMLQVLDRNLYEPVVACPCEGAGDLDALLHAADCEVVAAPLLEARFTSNPIALVKYIVSFARAIRAFRTTIRALAPDLLHANSVRAGIVVTLATMGSETRVLWHVQDDLPPHVISLPIRWLAHGARRTRAVAVSRATAKAFAGGLDFKGRLDVLHNAVDRERFPRKGVPLDADALRVRTELGLKAGDRLAVTVGMIHPRKGLLELVETFAEVVQHDSSVHLALAGAAIFNKDSLYEARVKARSRELGLEGRVHFLGARKDVAAVLRAADVFVLNAQVEPFGLVVLEAMASGTPVIATCVGGIPEIVQDGVSGELVAPPRGTSEDPLPTMATRLQAAFWNPEGMARLADAAHRTVLPRFSMELFTVRLHRLYADVFADREAR